MSVNSGLNEGEIRFSDGSFSDGEPQHFNCIAKRMRGRDQKMKGGQKNPADQRLASGSAGFLG